MKYTFVTGLHGNEPIPVLALASMGVKQYVANGKALSENKRFIDVDLNKSFLAEGNGYEIGRSKEILEEISPDSIVIDFHTFSAVSEPFVVIVDETMIDLAIKTGLSKIVIMEHNIKNGHALINHRSGISVEVGQHTGYESFENCKRIYKNITENFSPKQKPDIYRVYDVISEPGKYDNFNKCSQGFYPVLAGEKAYEFYGLKATLE